MSNQIVITSGAKVRSLEGVLTGSSGIVGSVPLGAANGVATLDSMGKVPLSQLPASVVTYLGTWNAATNTPTLTNGVGDIGDLYICNVAGTVNFGAGPITFSVGDWVIYNGTQWQKSAGQAGTVTSVGLTSTAGAFSITNSPITTSGNIGLNFSGTSAQYVAGDGSLVTFPSIITQAQNLVTEVYNETGATLTKGTVVYINGGHGNLPTVTKALATSDATSAQTYGVVRADITNMNNGYVTVIGNLENIDTQAYPAGTQLYLSSTTAGAWTSVKQYAPAHLVYVGIVVRSHPTQGVVEVRIQNGYELDELHNVSAQTPSNNQGLFYNSSNSLWENKSIATALGYTPADDSLVVKLAGTQTITGTKTFNIATINESGILLKNGYGASASGYTGLGAAADQLWISVTAATHIFNFPSTTGRTYSFPTATGTIALTSDIPSLTGYVPYSGATTDLNLGTYSLFANSLNAQALGLNVPTGGGNPAITFYINSVSTGVISAGSSTLTFSAKNTGGFQFQNPSNATIFSISNTGVLGNGTYSYTLPSATGTLALTSNLSSYVPYTGATGNVDLGANNLTLQHLIANGLTGVSGTLQLKQNTGFAVSNGFTSIYTTGNNVAFTAASSGGTYYTAIFGLSSLSSSRTYTLPDASGTVALTSNLSSYVPYTGATSNVTLGTYGISGNAASFTGYIQTDANLLIKNVGKINTISGYNAIYSLASGFGIGFSDFDNHDSIFSFSTAGDYTYTFPASSGTIALTSNLSSYLPLSGGTLTGALNGTSATFSSIVTATADSNAAAFIALARSADDLSQIRFNNNANSNTNAIISVNKVGSNGGEFSISTKPDGSPLSTRLTIASTGAATFASNIIGNATVIASTGLRVRKNTTSDGATDLGIFYSNSGDTFYLYDWNTATKGLALNTGTGAATFSSTIASSTHTISSANSTQLTITNTEAWTNGSIAEIRGHNVIGINQLRSGTTNGLYVGAVSGSIPAIQSADQSNNAISLSINPFGGNVGIGTTSPQRPLHVKGVFEIEDGTSSYYSLIYQSTQALAIETENATAITLNTNATERMRITSGGSLLLNYTGSTGDNLYIVGKDGYWMATMAGSSTTGNSFGLNILAGTNSSDQSLLVRSVGGSTYFRVRGDGMIFAQGVYSNTTGSSANVWVDTDGTLRRSTSSLKYKENVQNYSKGLAEVMQLRPVSYQGKSDVDSGKTFAGLIAEEVHELGLTEFVQYAEDGSPDALAYASMVSLLTKAIQELKSELDELKSKIN